MTLPYHLTASVAFALVGQWEAAIATVAPDLCLLPNTIKGLVRGEPVWRTIQRVVDSPILLASYKLSHSLLLWGSVAGLLGSWWVLIGAATHLLMDLSHYGRLSPQWLYPLGRKGGGRVVVPLSGGYDSARCLTVARGSYPRRNIFPVFVAYGHPDEVKEREAARYVCLTLGLVLEEVAIPRIVKKTNGEFPDRNFLILLASLRGKGASEILIGSRAPFPMFDNYGDCAPRTIRKFLLRNGYARVRVGFPCLMLPNRVIVSGLKANGLDLDRLFSTK